MELFCCGFNAWGQLDFQGIQSAESRDLRTFRCVLQDQHIEILRTTVSATLVKTSSALKTAGCPDSLIHICVNKQDGLSGIAIAGNDKVAEIKGNIITQYNSLKSYLGDAGDDFGEFEDFEKVVANQTAFTVLSKTGKVWTWGDGRYESCLGREVSEQSPAHLPCLVEDLVDLPTGPIRKLSSGGYVTAALTSGNDLYIWGGRPGESKLLELLSGTPEPVDLGEDVLDVAVGSNHMMALTTERNLYVVGGNSNGQLGLDLKELSEWTKVSLPLKENQQIFSVHAGYKNSFVLLENIT